MTFVPSVARVVVVLTLASAAMLPWAVSASADAIRDEQWYLSRLDITQAHRISDGAGITVGLLDTGVEASHRDLLGAVLAGIDLIPGSHGDGRRDLDGHGTAMAGIIAGRGHGSEAGVLGVAPLADLLPIRGPIDNFADSAFVTRAIDFAIARHAKVINMSFGSRDDANLHEAIRRALAADIVVVAAAGNGEKNGTDYPGKYPEVLSVGAYDREGNVGPFSTTGPQVDLVAPGVDIVTTSNHSGYYKGQGTSAAAAIVSGAAALLRARFPRLSAAEIVHRLTATADDAGPPGRDDAYGYGRLDIVRALTADVGPLPSSAAPSGSASARSGPAPADTSAAGNADLPKPASPLVLTGIIVGVMVLAGIVAIVLVARRRKAGRSTST